MEIPGLTAILLWAYDAVSAYACIRCYLKQFSENTMWPICVLMSDGEGMLFFSVDYMLTILSEVNVNQKLSPQGAGKLIFNIEPFYSSVFAEEISPFHCDWSSSGKYCREMLFGSIFSIEVVIRKNKISFCRGLWAVTSHVIRISKKGIRGKTAELLILL